MRCDFPGCTKRALSTDRSGYPQCEEHEIQTYWNAEELDIFIHGYGRKVI